MFFPEISESKACAVALLASGSAELRRLRKDERKGRDVL